MSSVFLQKIRRGESALVLVSKHGEYRVNRCQVDIVRLNKVSSSGAKNACVAEATPPTFFVFEANLWV